jgi:hypothetical protein
MDLGTLEWVAAELKRWLDFAIVNFDLAHFPELLAKAHERFHGTEAELTIWLRELGVTVPDDLTIEERVRAGFRRAYDHKKNGGAAEVLDDFLTRL